MGGPAPLQDWGVGVAQTQGGAPQMWLRVVPSSVPLHLPLNRPRQTRECTRGQDSRPVQSRARPGHTGEREDVHQKSLSSDCVLVLVSK